MKTTDTLINCPNNYTKESIFDLFMEREEDIEICKKCTNLCYVSGTLSCVLLNQLSQE